MVLQKPDLIILQEKILLCSNQMKHTSKIKFYISGNGVWIWFFFMEDQTKVDTQIIHD